ncbi:MAG: type III pantothenate kinase [Deltaproteobacteria bacterium]
MLLALDVGNTDAVIGIFQGKSPIFSWRVNTCLLKSFFSKKKDIKRHVNGAIVSSVVPAMNPTIRFCLRKWKIKKVLFVTQRLNSPISLKVDRPSEVGADRIVNAVAAYEKFGGPLLVIDLGTATTIDYIDHGGAYRGGVIIPGLKISAEALFERAEKLFRIELKSSKKILGTNTVSQMQSGTVRSYAIMLDAMIQEIRREIKKRPTIILTGGLGHMIKNLLATPHHFEPHLTLKGLQSLWQYNIKD